MVKLSKKIMGSLQWIIATKFLSIFIVYNSQSSIFSASAERVIREAIKKNYKTLDIGQTWGASVAQPNIFPKKVWTCNWEGGGSKVHVQSSFQMRQHLDKCKIHRQTHRLTNSQTISFVCLFMILYDCARLCRTLYDYV